MSNRIKTLAIAAAVTVAFSGPSLAADKLASGAGPQSSTSVVTLDVPSVVGIDVETDVAFSFVAYSAPANPSVCINVFPPGSSCKAVTTDGLLGGYLLYPSSTTTPATATPSPTYTADSAGTETEGALYVAIMDTDGATTRSIAIKSDATWTGTSPGFTPVQAIQTMKSGANNSFLTAGIGETTFTSVTATDVALAEPGTFDALPAFGWTRIDQQVRLKIDLNSFVPTTTASAVATLTYTFSKT